MSYVDKLLFQFIVFHYIVKGQSVKEDAEGEKDQQARSSQREQGDPEMDQEPKEDPTEGEAEQTDLQREADEAAAATHSTAGCDLGGKDTGPRQES